MKKTCIFILTILAFLFTFSIVNVKAENTYDTTIKLGDIPSSTIAAEYGAIVKDGITIQAYAGYFDASATGYGLVKYDTKASDNSVTCSTKTGLTFENWQYQFNGNSVVIEVTATAKGTLVFDTSASTSFGGWIDWNSAYIVRKVATDGTVTNLIYDYHQSDDGVQLKADYALGLTQSLESGEKIYFEFGADASRNFQNMQDSTINYTKYVEPVKEAKIDASSVKFNDIPYYQWYYSYQALEATGFKVQAYAGMFDETNASNYGLVNFDTKGSDDNTVTCSTKTGLTFTNWKYSFNNNSIVYEITAVAKGTIKVDYSACTSFTGWIDWNSAYIVRKLSSDGTLTNLVYDYHLSDTPEATIKADVAKGTEVLLEAGEKLYIEFGASAERNFQNLQDAVISYTAYTEPEPEPEPKEDLTLSTIEFSNLPYYTWYYDYGTIKTTDFVINTYAGFFDASAENYGLTAFDTKSDDNTVTCSSKTGLTFNNWQYTFNSNSIVLAFTASESGRFTVDYSKVSLGGWIDWNSAYIVRLLKKDGTLTNLVYDYQLTGDNDDYNKTTIINALSKGFSVLVDEGDTLYIEFGAGAADRNYQGLNNATITFSLVTEEMTTAIKEMNDAFNALYDTDYTNEDYAAIKALLETNTDLIYNAENNEKITSYKNEFLTKINETKTNLNFFNIPYFVITNDFGYYNGKFISYTAYAGTARSLIKFDTKVDDNTMKSTLNNDVTMANWQYNLTASCGVVIVIKANADVKVNLLKDSDNLGWMENALYNVYLLTNGNLYLLSSVSPTGAADFAKSYNLKANEELYLEFICESTCDASRNFQIHGSMNLTAYTDFDEAAYNTQNAMINTIEAKKAELAKYVAALNESDYTEASWNIINGYVTEFNKAALNYLSEDGLTEALAKAEANIDEVLTIAEAKENLDKYRSDSLDSLKKYYDALTETNHYTASSLLALKNVYEESVKGFEALETIEEIDAKLASSETALNAVEADTLFEERTAAMNAVSEAFSKINKVYYNEEKYNAAEAKVNNFLSNIETYATAEEITAAKEEVLSSIDALVPEKEGISYLDMPLAIKEYDFGWVEGSLFDYTAMTGSVEDGLFAFDTYDETNNALSLSTVNGTLMQNWKWLIMPDNGIILMFRANDNIKLTISDTRTASGTGTNGWTDDCYLVYYIVRNEVVKTIKTVSKPTTDADFSGEFYLKTGDILYVEFNTSLANSQRNTEAPYATVAVASDDFDEDLYVAQNHDLAKEVKAEIEAKIKALNDYVLSLNKDDYSLSNWANIEDYNTTFASTVENNVTTIEDVDKVYEEALANMKAVETLAQAKAELDAYLETVKAALKNAYDELVNNNSYTTENKASLDKIYNDAVAEIAAAQSKVQANSIKVKAVQSMNAVEKAVKEETKKSGCGSSLAVISVLPFLALGACLVLKRKENEC